MGALLGKCFKKEVQINEGGDTRKIVKKIQFSPVNSKTCVFFANDPKVNIT